MEVKLKQKRNSSWTQQISLHQPHNEPLIRFLGQSERNREREGERERERERERREKKLINEFNSGSDYE